MREGFDSMRNVILAVLVLSIVGVTEANADEEADKIGKELNVAREAYTAAVQIAHEKLLVSVDDEIKRAAASGSLEVVKSLQKEKMSIEADASYESKVIRLRSHTSRRTTEIKVAKDRFRTSLVAAKTAYTKALKIVEAEAADAELMALSMVTATVRVPKKTSETSDANPTRVPESLEEGLVLLLFDRIASQQGNDGYVVPNKLGKPVAEPVVVSAIEPFTFDAEKNAIAFGFLKIDEPGEYHFRTYSHYDRNALFVAGKLVCPYRGSVAGGSEPSGAERIVLRKGVFPFVLVGYVDSKGSVDVTWKPPGQKEFVPVPKEKLFHESKDGAVVVPTFR